MHGDILANLRLADEIAARHAIAAGTAYRKTWRRKRNGLIVFNPFWMTEQKVAFGSEQTFHLYDWKRDQMVPVAMQDLLTTTSATSQTYTSKSSWNNGLNYIAAIGGGGAGAHGASTSTGGGGGGGGAYNRIANFTFATPGTTTSPYFVQAGLLHGGTFPGTAPDSGFGNSVLASSNLLAKGGVSPATATSATGGAGGLASGGNPTTSPPARNGGTAASGTSATAGGGGGGAGGPSGLGGPGVTTTGGNANGGPPAGVAGGSPGNPGTSNSGDEFDATHGCGSGAGGSNTSGGTGGNGGLYGGGAGGGSRSTGIGGDGAQGIVALSSVFPEFADISSDSARAILLTITEYPYW
jgi:hypothetical protein